MNYNQNSSKINIEILRIKSQVCYETVDINKKMTGITNGKQINPFPPSILTT